MQASTAASTAASTVSWTLTEPSSGATLPGSLPCCEPGTTLQTVRKKSRHRRYETARERISSYHKKNHCSNDFFIQIIAATIHREGKETRPYLSCFPVRRELRQLLLQPPSGLRAVEVRRVRKAACFPAPRSPSMPLSLVCCSTCNHTLAACHECVCGRRECRGERIRI